MRFVEQTGGSWTAEQLRLAEAEIEHQKREWEANRLAALKKEEEQKRIDDEENEPITYSREDSKNQVNTNKIKKPLDKRLTVVKNTHKIVKNNRSSLLGKRKLIVKKSSSSDGKKKRQKINNSTMNKKTVKLVSKKNIKNKLSPTRRPTRKSANNSISLDSSAESDLNSDKNSNSGESVHDDNDDDDDDVEKEEDEEEEEEEDDEVDETTQNSFNDSECSLDVMIDSNDAAPADSDSNQPQSRSESTNSGSSGSSFKLKDKNIVFNHVDANSPRTTRSRGSVKINLWTLDVSPILHKTGRNNSRKSENESCNNLKTDDEVGEGIGDNVNSVNKKEEENNVSEVKKLKVAKILDGLSTTTPSIQKKIGIKKNNLPKNGTKNKTLDSWVSKTPNVKILINKLSSAEIETGQVKGVSSTSSPNSEYVFRTRRTSILKHAENGPS